MKRFLRYFALLVFSVTTLCGFYPYGYNQPLVDYCDNCISIASNEMTLFSAYPEAQAFFQGEIDAFSAAEGDAADPNVGQTMQEASYEMAELAILYSIAGYADTANYYNGQAQAFQDVADFAAGQ